MKIQELRQLLSSAERSRVEKAFVESYKQLKKISKRRGRYPDQGYFIRTERKIRSEKGKAEF